MPTMESTDGSTRSDRIPAQPLAPGTAKALSTSEFGRCRDAGEGPEQFDADDATGNRQRCLGQRVAVDRRDEQTVGEAALQRYRRGDRDRLVADREFATRGPRDDAGRDPGGVHGA